MEQAKMKDGSCPECCGENINKITQADKSIIGQCGDCGYLEDVITFKHEYDRWSFMTSDLFVTPVEV